MEKAGNTLQFTSKEATNPNHWHNFVYDETPRKSPEIGPPKTGIGIEKTEQEIRKFETNLEQQQVTNILHSYGVKDPLVVHGSQIILSDNLLTPSNGGAKCTEEEILENNERTQTEKGKIEKDVSKPKKSTKATTGSSQVFSIDNVTKDQFEPLTQSIVTEKITTK